MHGRCQDKKRKMAWDCVGSSPLLRTKEDGREERKVKGLVSTF